MAQHNCQICHKEATHYLMYRDLFSFLCNSKICDYKWQIKSGIFKTDFEITPKGV